MNSRVCQYRPVKNDARRRLYGLLSRLLTLLVLLIPATGIGQQLPVPGSLSVLTDPAAGLTLSGALANRDAWVPADGIRGSARFTSGAVWFRWTQQSAKSVRGRLLQLDTGSARGIKAWLLNSRGQVLRQFVMGANQSFKERSRPQRRFVVPLPSSKKTTLIARFESVEPVQFSPALWCADELQEAKWRSDIGHVLLVGVTLSAGLAVRRDNEDKRQRSAQSNLLKSHELATAQLEENAVRVLLN